MKAVHETSQGVPSPETCCLLKNLARPLPETVLKNSVKLFSTNELVDDYNRDKLLQFPGALLELKSHDEGKKYYYSSDLLAPRMLWLKIGVPVILLRNLSDVLVNGMLGEVCDFEGQRVWVHFPSIQKKVSIEKFRFEGKTCMHGLY